MERTNHLSVEELRDIVQDAHLNFLLGAGASADLFKPLGDVEDWLTYLAQNEDVPTATLNRVRASVYAYFFEGVIDPNADVINESLEASPILDTYRGFLRTLNTLLVRRRSSILDKQVNLFTTNVDLATEVAAEELQLELNDGFSGRYLPMFSASNFGTVKSRRSLQYDNLAEVPTFNLFKLHGSTSWATRKIDLGEETKEVITFNPSTEVFDSIRGTLHSANGALYDVDKGTKIDELVQVADKPTPLEESLLDAFMAEYEQLAIVNPTKDKFGLTVLNQNYYDLLRIFSNTLEKENSILFIIGFSCRDEHIRELIIRAARTNPTLQVIVFAYHPDEAQALKDRLNADLAANGNILVVSTPKTAEETDQETYTLSSITKAFFEPLLPKAPRKPDSVVDVRLKLAEPLEIDDVE
ncbi:SIR2 family protein [Pseudoclavibacter sp. CFCC 11306]|uniref:SIR2 family protein n=1 Tax=Pseudoclavibacter sp. CFCC 11306 TaxID=1564493 RepID=UPI0017877D36|nr:SIR2 family protein [Pseudoclavibacter sp. CFCC 11306]